MLDIADPIGDSTKTPHGTVGKCARNTDRPTHRRLRCTLDYGFGQEVWQIVPRRDGPRLAAIPVQIYLSLLADYRVLFVDNVSAHHQEVMRA